MCARALLKCDEERQIKGARRRRRMMEKLSASITWFRFLWRSNMIRKEAAVKRDVSLTLSHVRCQLPRGNCFPLKMNSVKRDSVCERARQPASPADFECMEHPPSRRLFHISGWKNNGDVHAELRQKQSLQLWGLFFTLFPFENTHWQQILFGTKHLSDAPVIIFP